MTTTQTTIELRKERNELAKCVSVYEREVDNALTSLRMAEKRLQIACQDASEMRAQYRSASDALDAAEEAAS